MAWEKTAKIQLIEMRLGEPLESMVERMAEAGMTDTEMAARLGVSYYTFRFWVRKLGGRRLATIRFDDTEQSASVG